MGNQPRAYPFYQVKAALVVGEGNAFPLDPLRFVFLLLELEDVLGEVLLKRLVRIVDAQLLQAVPLHIPSWRASAITLGTAHRKEGDLTAKFSKPKMSNTPMNLGSAGFLPSGSSSGSAAIEALILPTSQLNKRSYRDLARVSRASVA